MEKWDRGWARKTQICVFQELYLHTVKFYWASVLPFAKWDVIIVKDVANLKNLIQIKVKAHSNLPYLLFDSRTNIGPYLLKQKQKI